MSTITPTVGRKVWFYASNKQEQPHDATVIKVHSQPDLAQPTSYVNLLVVDPDTGATRCESSVCVGDEFSTSRHYRWMPYQQGQAKAKADVGTVGTAV